MVESLSRTGSQNEIVLGVISGKRRSVTEQLLAFFSEKTAGERNEVIALLEDELAGDETGSQLVVCRTALAAVSRNVFLGNAVDNRANSRQSADRHRGDSNEEKERARSAGVFGRRLGGGLGWDGFGAGGRETEADEPFAGNAVAAGFGRSELPAAGRFQS